MTINWINETGLEGFIRMKNGEPNKIFRVRLPEAPFPSLTQVKWPFFENLMRPGRLSALFEFRFLDEPDSVAAMIAFPAHGVTTTQTIHVTLAPRLHFVCDDKQTDIGSITQEEFARH